MSQRHRTTYLGERSIFGINTRFEFGVTIPLPGLSAALANNTDKSLKAFNHSALLPSPPTETVRTRIGSLSGLKLIYALSESEERYRKAVYLFPSPKNDFLYVFTITATEGNFEKWFLVAEASLRSFEILNN